MPELNKFVYDVLFFGSTIAGDGETYNLRENIFNSIAKPAIIMVFTNRPDFLSGDNCTVLSSNS